jgi:hypothetical protein
VVVGQTHTGNIPQEFAKIITEMYPVGKVIFVRVHLVTGKNQKISAMLFDILHNVGFGYVATALVQPAAAGNRVAVNAATMIVSLSMGSFRITPDQVSVPYFTRKEMSLDMSQLVTLKRTVQPGLTMPDSATCFHWLFSMISSWALSG